MMFRLPVCPHCGTVYRYKDTKDAIKKKKNVCYHCKKDFTARLFPYALVLLGISAVMSITINIILLNRMETLNLIALIAVTSAFIMIAIILLPFFVKFKKEDITKDKKNK